MNHDGSGSGLAANLDKAGWALAQFKGAPTRHLIAGEAVESRAGGAFETLSPVDNSILATVAAGDASDIDAAAQAAAAAFPAWRAVSGARRRAILHAMPSRRAPRKSPAPPADAFGGMKASGIGRDGGDYSFDFYMETRTSPWPMTPTRWPRIGGLDFSG